VDVDLVSREDAKSFTFLIGDPTFKADYSRVDFAGLYGSDELIELEEEDELRRARAASLLHDEGGWH
jgi:hypothetical protein